MSESRAVCTPEARSAAMTPERLRRLEQIFTAAVELGAGQRASFVAEQC